MFRLILQRPGGDKAVTISKAEKAAIALSAAFILFFAGWFARGRLDGGYYSVSVQNLLPNEVTPSPSPTGAFLPEERVDLNTAALDDLTGLPGLGPVRAQAILDYRAAHGNFVRIEDVMRVKGIGESIFQQLEPYLTVSSSPGGEAS